MGARRRAAPFSRIFGDLRRCLPGLGDRTRLFASLHVSSSAVAEHGRGRRGGLLSHAALADQIIESE